MRKILLAGVALVALSGTAMANDLPSYNVETHCQQVSNFGGGSHMIYNGCITQEQMSYNTLKTTWNNLSTRIKTHCSEVGAVSGGSYMILKGCVDMENQARNNTATFQR